MGARAYAAGNRVAFASAPDLHLAAHEVAHVVQQRGGVQLSGGVGAAGDIYERHADAVADRVVRGESAEALLDQHAPARSSGGGGVQRVIQRWATEPAEAVANRQIVQTMIRSANPTELRQIVTALQAPRESLGGVVLVQLPGADRTIALADLDLAALVAEARPRIAAPSTPHRDPPVGPQTVEQMLAQRAALHPEAEMAEVERALASSPTAAARREIFEALRRATTPRSDGNHHAVLPPGRNVILRPVDFHNALSLAQSAVTEAEASEPGRVPPVPDGPECSAADAPPGPLSSVEHQRAYLDDLRMLPASGTGDMVRIRMPDGSTQVMSRHRAEVLRAQTERTDLAAAVHFPTRIESIVVHTHHAFSRRLAGEMRTLLLAKHVFHDPSGAEASEHSMLQLTGNLRETARAFGEQAANRHTWAAEQLAIEFTLEEIDGIARMALAGVYNHGSETRLSRALTNLEEQLLQALSPAAGAGAGRAVRGPGGSMAVTIPVGMMVVPGGILTFFLKLRLERMAADRLSTRDAAGGTDSVAASTTMEVDEHGAMRGGASAQVRRTAGADQVTAQVEMDHDGPHASIEQQHTTEDGGSVTASAAVSGDGFEAEYSAANPAGWTSQVTMNNDGVSFQISHSSGLGAQLGGTVAAPELTMMLPDIRLGQAQVHASIKIEMTPMEAAMVRTATQTEEVQRLYRNSVLLLAGVAVGVPLAGAAMGSTLALGAGEAVVGGAAAEGGLGNVLINLTDLTVGTGL